MSGVSFPRQMPEADIGGLSGAPCVSLEIRIAASQIDVAASIQYYPDNHSSLVTSLSWLSLETEEPLPGAAFSCLKEL